MERFNPFTSDSDPDPFTTSFNRSSEATLNRQSSSNRASQQEISAKEQMEAEAAISSDQPEIAASTNSRYTTSFPDPFGDLSIEQPSSKQMDPSTNPPPARATTTITGNRSNSVTFAPLSHSVDDPPSSTSKLSDRRPTGHSRRTEAGSGGFTSFLSRATSVTSGSVTDRVSGAVGSVRSAVDSISSQIQQAVPSNLTSTASNLISGGGGASEPSSLQDQQQQSAASYLASKFSSATGQFTSAGQNQTTHMPIISRQRVVLILDSLAQIDWALQFTNYRRQTAGLAPLNSSQSAFSSFFSQATAQLSSSSSLGANLDADLIEQVDPRNVSVLANQSTSTATVFVAPSQHHKDQQQQQQQQQNQPLIRTNSQSTSRSQQQAFRIIRPEYVVVRQRTKDRQDELKSIVNALNYCLVPMFEPIEVWNCFQDRQLLFSRLLRIQKHLGRENFPLIPQVYCQTNQDLLNYINSSSVYMPCLVRIGSKGQGKIRIDNQPMFRDFSTIMATSGLSCTVEPYLDVKCDLVIQKIGNNLKSFKKQLKKQPQHQSSVTPEEARLGLMSDGSFGPADGTSQKQSAFRQTSLGSGVLSSLMASSSSSNQHQHQHQQQQQQQQLALDRRSSASNLAFEKVSEVNVRYKTWIEAVEREFNNEIEAFCIKVAVASNDREYIVGMRDCAMEFLGTLDNQDEDKRSFIELIISHMNRNLPKHSTSNSICRETPSFVSNMAPSSPASQLPTTADFSLSNSLRRTSSDDKSNAAVQPYATAKYSTESPSSTGLIANLAEKKKFTSQTQINGGTDLGRSGSSGLGNRSQSVSVNQSDYLKDEHSISKPYFVRRGSDQSDSSTESELTTRDAMGSSSLASNSTSSGLHQRQSSLGQSFFDQTSTALSSFQKQSMSFFKRFDAQASGSNTPPQSAKSDRSFLISSTRSAPNNNVAQATGVSTGASSGASTRNNGFKSQSMDTPGLDSYERQSTNRKTPPKPPPPAPQSLVNRQSSLASSYGSGLRNAHAAPSSTATPNSSPAETRQNSTVSEVSQQHQHQQQQRNRVVRQNSALSAFEPFDQELPASIIASASISAESKPTPSGILDRPQRPLESVTKKSGNFDSASITSGDSNSTGETVTGEDTMNNLKKTFASIFGDKCE